MVWSSLFSPLPLVALSWGFEGGDADLAALAHLTWVSWGALAYLAYLSTLVGYGLWNWLIVKKGASAVAPFSLLVPVFGVSSAWLFLGEALTPVHWAAAGLVLAGLVLHGFGGKIGRPVH
jgi:O-acetylserine/cysteine efflux transporter